MKLNLHFPIWINGVCSDKFTFFSLPSFYTLQLSVSRLRSSTLINLLFVVAVPNAEIDTADTETKNDHATRVGSFQNKIGAASQDRISNVTIKFNVRKLVDNVVIIITGETVPYITTKNV